MTCLRSFLLVCLLAWPVRAVLALGGDFTLHNPDGKAVSLASLRGKVVLLYFGFTQCPELCPTTLLQFQQVRATLPTDQRSRVQPVFVSLDPERDTPVVLQTYASHFGGDILALTGSVPMLHKVTAQYGAYFRYVPTGAGYTVDHTVNVYLIDTSGKLVKILPYGTPIKEMQTQLERLLR
jgi:protein SCO1/2